jgi:hypothetical protein
MAVEGMRTRIIRNIAGDVSVSVTRDVFAIVVGI